MQQPHQLQAQIQTILDTASGIQSPEPSPFLEHKILRRLEAEMRARPEPTVQGWRWQIAAVTLILIANALTLALLRPASSTPATSASTTDYWEYTQDLNL